MLLGCKNVCQCEGKNNICSLIFCAFLVVSTDQRESVTYSEHRVNSEGLNLFLHVCNLK